MKKTIPLLLAGLLAAGGVMAQSAGDTSMTTQPGSPSQSTNATGGTMSPPSSLPGSGGVGLSSSPSTSTMGAGPSTTVVVPVVPVAVVPVTPFAVEQPRFGRGNVTTRAVDTGNGTIEGNGGAYDDAWWGPRPVYVYVPR